MKILLILAMVASTFLAKANGPSDFTTSFNTGIYSAYVGRVGINFYDHPVVISDVTIGYGDFWVNIWNATRLEHKDNLPYGSSFGDEWDVSLGYTHAFEHVKVDAFYSQFILADFNQLDDDLGVAEVTLTAVSAPFVQPFLTVRHFIEVASQSPEGGWFVWMGLRKTQPLEFLTIKERQANLNLEAGTAYSDGALRRDSGFVMWRFVTSLSLPVWEDVTLTPLAVVNVPTADQRHTSRQYLNKVESVFGLKLTWTF